MKTRYILMTTALSTGIMFGFNPVIAADNITTNTVKTANTAISKAELSDPRVAATSFVEHVNYARVALAMKNVGLGKQHITQARNMVAAIKNMTEEQRRITGVESGRVVYQYDTEYKYHYFPIRTGPVPVKQMDTGPMWATNELAVTDADMVYLTLDVRGNRPEEYLDAAESAIAANDLKSAEKHLAQLTKAIVTIDSKVSMPSVKARDNIALARDFIIGKNYEGANYALTHADEALDEMQRDDTYKTQRDAILAMRKEVKTLQAYIKQKDPTMVQKTANRMDAWWKDLNEWSKNQ